MVGLFLLTETAGMYVGNTKESAGQRSVNPVLTGITGHGPRSMGQFVVHFPWTMTLYFPVTFIRQGHDGQLWQTAFHCFGCYQVRD